MSISNPSGSPVKESSLQVPLAELLWREMLHFQSPLSSVSQESLVNEPPPPGPLWTEMSISRAFFYTVFGALKKGLLMKQNLNFLSKSLVKEPPNHIFPTGPLWKELLCFHSQ